MIDGDYFAAMSIPLRAGRLFATSDSADAPPVAIVNETEARRLFNTVEAALGRRIRTKNAVGERTRRGQSAVGMAGLRPLAPVRRRRDGRLDRCRTASPPS
jgi:hypothetical protein